MYVADWWDPGVGGHGMGDTEGFGRILRIVPGGQWIYPARVDLANAGGALMSIAWEASRQKRLGARALRETYRRVIRSLEFEPAAGGTLTIDEEMVRKAQR